MHVPARALPSPLMGGRCPKGGVGVLSASNFDTGPSELTTSEQRHASLPHPPSGDPPHKGEGKALLLSVENVTREYPGKSAHRSLPSRRCFAPWTMSRSAWSRAARWHWLGRSGCGKSTLARLVLALDTVSAGNNRVPRANDHRQRDEADLRPARRNMQIVFQDPYGSFDPRHQVERLVAEPLGLLEPISKQSRNGDDLVAHALHQVGLKPDDMQKYPHEFSGGQRQRISIARAIITRPKLIVADEAVSALDVSIRAQILDLFAELNHAMGLGVFVHHPRPDGRAGNYGRCTGHA